MTIRFCIRCQVIAALVLVAGIAVALDAGIDLHRATQHHGATVQRGDGKPADPVLRTRADAPAQFRAQRSAATSAPTS